jgi:hypothetical protein
VSPDISRSRHAEQFVLKGALLLLVWLGETLRPTRDADLLGFGDLSDDVLREIVRDICTIDVEPDAVIFLPDTVHVRAIREEDTYGGQRVALEARLGPARLRVQVDVGIGDAVTPAPQWLEYPTLLDLPRPRLRAYPRKTVIAEKLHAMVVLGTRNSRLKDHFDVEVLLREDALDAAQLAKAIASTFERRRTDIPRDVPSGLSDAFSGDATCQARWAAFLDRNRLQGPPLGELVRAIRDRLASAMAQARGQAQP